MNLQGLALAQDPRNQGGVATSPHSHGSARWYVVQTLAYAEARACAQLRAQRFDVFYPRVERTVRHARKMSTSLSAAFPGYLFVHLDLQRDRWRSVNGTIGVSRLIMAHDLPQPVPVGVVESLATYVDEKGVARFDRDLSIGQTVRVKHGPMAQAVGELVRLEANERVRVLLDIMGGKIEARLAAAAIEAA